MADMTNYGALKLAANTIKEEVEDGANTASRVGSALLNLIEAINTDLKSVNETLDEAILYDEGTDTFNDF